MTAPSIRVVSVNAGRVARIGERQGAPVRSAIRKKPVVRGPLPLSTTQLEGDRQADLRVHGGPEKAVFAYPLAHLQVFAAERGDGEHFVPGSIGENLTVEGDDETTVCIGDTWRWGTALLQVCQPRTPCYKLGMRTGWPEILRLFEERGWSGWYLRVLEPGDVPVPAPGGYLELGVEERDDRGLSVRDAAHLLRRDRDPARLRAAVAHPALATAWRRALQQRLASLDTATT